MGIAFLILLGASIGWLAAVVTQADARATTRNCVAGVGGALAGGLLVSPLFEKGNIVSGGYAVEALLIALIAATAATMSANLLHRREFR